MILRAVAAAGALAATAPMPAAEPAGTPLRAGDRVEFDVSAFPRRYEGAGKVLCKGTVLSAVGPTETTCERSFRFEVPPGDVKMTSIFRPSAGGKEARIDLPLTRQAKPIVFTAPADGTLQPPAPVTIPDAVGDRALRTAAERECGRCRGGEFELVRFEATQRPAPVDGGPSYGIKITSPPAGARP